MNIIWRSCFCSLGHHNLQKGIKSGLAKSYSIRIKIGSKVRRAVENSSARIARASVIFGNSSLLLWTQKNGEGRNTLHSISAWRDALMLLARTRVRRPHTRSHDQQTLMTSLTPGVKTHTPIDTDRVGEKGRGNQKHQTRKMN